MIKKCKVLWRNELVTVVLFDEIEVQLPPTEANADEIFVRREGLGFWIADSAEDGETGKETTTGKGKTNG